jgi:uncharacterized LabA/DUF88 family protein
MLDKLLAVFVDVENAFPDFNREELRAVFDYLAGIGEISLCRGYADWSKLANKKQEAFEWNIATINLFVRGGSRKNAADIAITVDAMEELHTVKEITTFVLIGGDSDLAPLATKLREKGKEVIGVSKKAVVSPYFIKACAKFVYLDDLIPTPLRLNVEKETKLNEIKDKLKRIVEDKFGKDKLISAGTLKILLLQKDLGFDEKQYGFKTFTQFLESLAEFEIIRSATGAVNARLVEDIEKAKSVEEKEEIQITEEAPPISLEEARDVLIRAIKSSQKSDALIDPAWLKSTILRMAPRFSEKSLGYSKFTDFIIAQKDLVKISRVEDRYIIELLGK